MFYFNFCPTYLTKWNQKQVYPCGEKYLVLFPFPSLPFPATHSLAYSQNLHANKVFTRSTLAKGQSLLHLAYPRQTLIYLKLFDSLCRPAGHLRVQTNICVRSNGRADTQLLFHGILNSNQTTGKRQLSVFRKSLQYIQMIC